MIQSDYEELYTGPEFILQIRYGQLLTLVFTAFTYSSGMPGLYLVIFVFIFLSYWVDKVLLLRYYRITKGYSHHMAEYVAATLPWAVVIHCAAGIMFFGYPHILNTASTPGYGNNTQYFNPKRLGQRHMVIFVALSIFVAALVAFEKLIVGVILLAKRSLQRACVGCLKTSRRSVDTY